MNTLLIDIGNTRIKWAMLRDARLGRMRATAHRGTAAALRKVVNAAPRDVERVLAVCVAGVRLERALTAAVRARFGVATEFVRSSRFRAGVRNAYRHIWRLGADRWVGAIAAHHMAGRRPVLVANIGTALTIDVVAADGRHRGGAIAPGPDTMIASLLGGTVGIRRRAQGASGRRAASSGLFATDTARALDSGARFAAAALIDRAVREAQAVFGRRPLVLLTGGAAGGLRIYIESVLRPVPDLVLRGLALLARG
jgi:type III pantothenate kinase